ncbi:MAG: response regulator, partial [Bacteroidales bacterium]|nr:response regulator [Bacteroidales bacterium]
FDRFERSEESTVEGHGVGLNYAQTLAKIHRGVITYRPSDGEGSVFTLTIPCRKEDYSEGELSETGTIRSERSEPVPEMELPLSASTKVNIVLVEDNEDVRVYLKSLFSDSFNVVTCSDGQEGLDRIRTIVPDIVISDVMMPKKDGFTLCRDLKTDPLLWHIPVILLTAKADSGSSIKGLEEGAEAYISKPFDPKYLMATVGSLLENRRLLQQRVLNLTSSMMESQTASGDAPVEGPDAEYMRKVQKIMDENLSEEDFNVESLAMEIGTSYSSLYAKIKALTGSSPQVYLTTYRLNIAKERLSSGKYTISEVAYSVGSSSPSNFSRAFKRHFGITPTEAMFRGDAPEEVPTEEE